MKLQPNQYLKLFLMLNCLFLSLSSLSQTVSTAYQNTINTTFYGVDKSKVPHKLLVDYAMEFTELSNYNGTLK